MCSVSHVTWCLPRKHQNVTTQEWQQNSEAMTHCVETQFLGRKGDSIPHLEVSKAKLDGAQSTLG